MYHWIHGPQTYWVKSLNLRSYLEPLLSSSETRCIIAPYIVQWSATVYHPSLVSWLINLQVSNIFSEYGNPVECMIIFTLNYICMKPLTWQYSKSNHITCDILAPRDIKHSVVSVWNHLPDNIRDAKTCDILKLRLKTHFCKIAFSEDNVLRIVSHYTQHLNLLLTYLLTYLQPMWLDCIVNIHWNNFTACYNSQHCIGNSSMYMAQFT